MRRIFTLTTLALLISLSAIAGQIKIEKARIVAKNFFFEKVSNKWDCSYEELTITGEFSISEANTPAIYIFNFNNKGFVMVSANDAANPVPGYSLSSNYSNQNIPTQLNSLLKHYKDQILEINKNKVQADPTTQGEWLRLSTDNPKNLNTKLLEEEVEPLLTSYWDQSPYYNDMCPDGEIGQAVTGCVATALGQLMYYFRFPETGTGSYTYTCENYGELSADFSAASYNYEEMIDALNRPNDAVALLIHHIGVSVDMDYGPDGSGMWNHSAANSLKNYFKFDPNTQYVFRDSTSMDWDSLLYNHLDRNIPMYYAGWHETDTSYGHAFICDGYQDDYFHFDWGWDGAYNGYFQNDNLYPGGSVFNYHQELIINAVPDTITYDYPQYCSGSGILTNHEGSISDGSSPLKDYQNNSSCNWLISPQNEQDSVSSIKLYFSRMDLADDDAVYVYDGDNDGATLLGMYSGEELPEEISTSGNTAYVVFESNEANTKGGFLLIYEAQYPNWCDQHTTVTYSYGNYSDGSGNFDYYNSELCRWLFQPTENGLLVFQFSHFDTKIGDHLTFYDMATSEILAKIEGSYPDDALPETISTDNDVMMVWKTNSEDRGDGWELNYTLYSDINKYNTENLYNIYPNPAKDLIYIQEKNNNSPIQEIIVSDIQGKIIHLQSFNNLDMAILDCSSWKAGMYFVTIISDNNKSTQKIVIE